MRLECREIGKSRAVSVYCKLSVQAVLETCIQRKRRGQAGDVVSVNRQHPRRGEGRRLPTEGPSPSSRMRKVDRYVSGIIHRTLPPYKR